jgi:hypothetical protein
MSIITDQLDPITKRYQAGSAKVRTASEKDIKSKKALPSLYNPSSREKDVREQILKDFRLGWQTMFLPRPEFNDLSLYQRHTVDMLAFNTYQENDGQNAEEDRLGGWKSNAVRPIIRNKAISMAAHRTARLTVPKVFAYNNQDEEQEDSAKVMGYLLDWAKDQANYSHQALYREIQAIYSPISWGLTEYIKNYREVKDTQNADGTWNYIEIEDEDESGFKHTPISTDQVFFANFFEKDAQKQDFLLIRRIISYDQAQTKYGKMKNWDYVKPGIIITMSDANNGFYQVYDPHMRDQDVEEIIYWRKKGRVIKDVRLIMVNGVVLGDYDAPNPRIDHQYPLDAYYYLPINERCIAGKSLVFSMQSDANIVSTLYQLAIDGAVLNQMPPTITTGSDKVGGDVFVPGYNMAFSEADVEIKPIRVADGNSLAATMNMLTKVEASVSESSQDPLQQGQDNSGPGNPSTAYAISRIEQNAATVLGFSMKFTAQHAINFGNLLVSDILQYITVAEAEKITEDGGLLYRTFFQKEPGTSGKNNKIQFDANLPDTMPSDMSDDMKQDMAWDILIAQGGIKSSTRLWKVNPILFRDYKYKFLVDSDVMNPRSSDLERAFDLETYDRAIASPVADQQMIYKDLLMASNPKTARDPSAYVSKTPPQQPGQVPGGQVSTPPPAPGRSSPLAAITGGNPINKAK